MAPEVVPKYACRKFRQIGTEKRPSVREYALDCGAVGSVVACARQPHLIASVLLARKDVKLLRSLVLVHYVVSEIPLRHMSLKSV